MDRAAGLPALCMQTGRQWIFGGGLALTSQMPRCSRMARITCLSSMKKNGAYHIAVKVDHRLFNIRCQLLHPWACPMSQAF